MIIPFVSKGMFCVLKKLKKPCFSDNSKMGPLASWLG